MASRVLTDNEMGLLKIALATLIQKSEEKSERVDHATDDPDLYDPIHVGIPREPGRAPRCPAGRLRSFREKLRH